MEIFYTPAYRKRYKKLDQRSKGAIDRAIRVFVEKPNAPELRNHALKGDYFGHRSIDAGFDLRIIFREEDGYTIVVFVDVGSHSQLYG